VNDILEVPRKKFLSQGITIRLVKPMLMFDKMGVAIGFVPAKDVYSYHHLRNDLHKLVLESSIKVDMCYTAPIAHVTLGRFVGSTFFDGIKRDENQEIETNHQNEDKITCEMMEMWIDKVLEINKELQEQWEEEQSWVIGESQGLEAQLGYVKFGRDTEKAEMVGNAFGKGAGLPVDVPIRT
jgi:hypothetical protein